MPRQPPQRRQARSRPGEKSRKSSGAAPRTLFEISAGGVMYRRTRNGIAICLIATRGRTRWQLPKGKQEQGESLEETAAREVAEETGLAGTVGPRLDKIDLWFTSNEGGRLVRHHKLVYFYLLEYQHGTTRDHDHEVDDARWFDAEEAMARLTFPSERGVVSRALALLAARAQPAPDRSVSARSIG